MSVVVDEPTVNRLISCDLSCLSQAVAPAQAVGNARERAPIWGIVSPIANSRQKQTFHWLLVVCESTEETWRRESGQIRDWIESLLYGQSVEKSA